MMPTKPAVRADASAYRAAALRWRWRCCCLAACARGLLQPKHPGRRLPLRQRGRRSSARMAFICRPRHRQSLVTRRAAAARSRRSRRSAPIHRAGGRRVQSRPARPDARAGDATSAAAAAACVTAIGNQKLGRDLHARRDNCKPGLICLLESDTCGANSGAATSTARPTPSAAHRRGRAARFRSSTAAASDTGYQRVRPGARRRATRWPRPATVARDAALGCYVNTRRRRPSATAPTARRRWCSGALQRVQRLRPRSDLHAAGRAGRHALPAGSACQRQPTPARAASTASPSAATLRLLRELRHRATRAVTSRSGSSGASPRAGRPCGWSRRRRRLRRSERAARRARAGRSARARTSCCAAPISPSAWPSIDSRVGWLHSALSISIQIAGATPRGGGVVAERRAGRACRARDGSRRRRRRAVLARRSALPGRLGDLPRAGLGGLCGGAAIRLRGQLAARRDAAPRRADRRTPRASRGSRTGAAGAGPWPSYAPGGSRASAPACRRDPRRGGSRGSCACSCWPSAR